MDTALIGAGPFVASKILPAIRKVRYLNLTAVYARTKELAESLMTSCADHRNVDIYADNSRQGYNYSDLLARQDISIFIIVQPMSRQHYYIRSALRAGKHVFSEKPIATDIQTAVGLVKWYRTSVSPYGIAWGVAENARYESRFVYAAQEVKKLGKVEHFRVQVQIMKENDRYMWPECIECPSWQRETLLIGGLHVLAALKLLLGDDIFYTVSSVSRFQPWNEGKGADMVHALLKTALNQTIGVVTLIFGSKYRHCDYEICCEQGTVNIKSYGVYVKGGHRTVVDNGAGILDGITDFAASLAISGAVDVRQQPEEALADLELAEKILFNGTNEIFKIPLNYQDSLEQLRHQINLEENNEEGKQPSS